MFSFLKNGDGKGAGSSLWILIIAAAVGIALLLIGNVAEADTQPRTEEQYRSDEEALLEYQTRLEDRIRRLCESVGGVGNTSVTVTLSGGFEAVYATEWKNGNEEYVILGSGSSASALYLTRSAPTITGIGIVCDGGGSERVRCELISLLGATFDVSTHRIYVTASK